MTANRLCVIGGSWERLGRLMTGKRLCIHAAAIGTHLSNCIWGSFWFVYSAACPNLAGYQWEEPPEASDSVVSPSICKNEGVMAVKMWRCTGSCHTGIGTEAACWAVGRVMTMRCAVGRGLVKAYSFQKAERAFIEVPRYTLSKVPRQHLFLHICFPKTCQRPHRHDSWSSWRPGRSRSRRCETLFPPFPSQELGDVLAAHGLETA